MICICDKALFNSIASAEGSKGRAQFKIAAKYMKFISLVGYNINSENKPQWHVEGQCPRCGDINLYKLRSFNNSKTCRDCAQATRNVKWAEAQDNPITYGRWKRMMARCYNKKAAKYFSHGARGIMVCEEWKNFDIFHRWCKLNKEFYGCHIHRKDNDGDYTPDNCSLISNSAHSEIHTKGNSCQWI